MKHLAIAIVVVVAIGLAGWAATSSSGDPGRNVAVAATTGDSGNAGAADAKPVAQSASQPAGTPTASTRPAESSSAADALAAMRVAADAKKHLFVFVQEDEQDEQTRAARKKFDAALAKLHDKVQSYTVNREEATEGKFVEQFGLKAAPMPVVLVLAPNGVVAGGFLGTRLTEALLVDSLAGPGKQQALKALQDRKLVMLCVQNSGTKSNDAAMKGVNAFKADARFAEFTEIVKIDPSDNAEKKFLAQLQVDPGEDQATTVFLAPPGAIVGKFSGATEKDKLVAALQAASAGGCGGGSSGCCPPPRK